MGRSTCRVHPCKQENRVKPVLVQTHTHTRTHARTHTRTRTHTHARAHTRARTHTHTHTHVRARAHTHTHIENRERRTKRSEKTPQGQQNRARRLSVRQTVRNVQKRHTSRKWPVPSPDLNKSMEGSMFKAAQSLEYGGSWVRGTHTHTHTHTHTPQKYHKYHRGSDLEADCRYTHFRLVTARSPH